MQHARFLALAVLAGPLATLAAAADLVVGPGGSIQAAIDQAVAGDRVLLLPGTYVETIDMKGKAIELVGLEGADETLLFGNGASVISLHQGEGATTRIRGLTVSGGHAYYGYGGGISGMATGVPPSTAVIEDCVIRGNSVLYGFGGGVAGDFFLLRCVISENSSGSSSAFGAGGGVYGAPAMYECAVVNNSVTKGAFGGVLITDSRPAYLYDCIIAGNSAYNVGGGVALDVGAVATIQRCVIANNALVGACLGSCVPGGPLATYGAAVFASTTASALILNSTLVDNVGNASGSGAPAVGVAGPMAVVNSIVRGNTGVQIDLGTVSYSNVEGGAPGPGNFDADPLFVHEPSGDHHLTAGSPCIDSGSPGMLDPDGSPIDLGAFPFASFYARRDLAAVDQVPGWASVSAQVGGEHPWRIHRGSAAAGDLYIVLGSVSGTSPGTPVLGATLPLVFDGWFAATLAHPGTGALVNTLGVLNGSGTADASLVIPAGVVIGPATAWHAALVVDPVTFAATATEAVELQLL